MNKNFLLIIIVFSVAIITGGAGVFGGYFVSKHFTKKINKENCKKFISLNCTKPNKINCKDYCPSTSTNCIPANKKNCEKINSNMISKCPTFNKTNCEKIINEENQKNENIILKQQNLLRSKDTSTIGNTTFIKNYQQFINNKTNGRSTDPNLQNQVDAYCKLAGFPHGQKIDDFINSVTNKKDANFQKDTYFSDFVGYVSFGNLSSTKANPPISPQVIACHKN